jgi:glycosyltransferase involved in cell wall biosynthesis
MIHVYSIVHNEEFLLPYFLRHYEKFVDKIFIIDDHSEDKTAEIAKTHPKVRYLEYPYWGRFEDDINCTYESLYKTFSTKADWVMLPDTDEFIYHPLLLEVLQQYSEFISVHSGLLKTVGYTMVSDHKPTTKGQIYDEIKTGVRTKTWDKPIIFSPLADVKLGDGRHTAEPDPVQTDIKLLHYRYLGKDWIMERNAKTYPRFDMTDKDRKYRIDKALAYYDKIQPDLKKVI